MKKIPSPRFEQDEVTRLIATFGSKPVPGKKQELQDMLKGEKAKFLTIERGSRNNGGREQNS